MNMIASKAVALKEALSDDFKQYQKRVLDNAQALSKGLMKRNINIVSGGTDNHLMLVDLQNMELTGKAAEKMLDEVHITVNKNTIQMTHSLPFCHKRAPPGNTSGCFQRAESGRYGSGG